jgi:hypothetical protein
MNLNICQGQTANGKQCTRKTTPLSNYCWQHQNNQQIKQMHHVNDIKFNIANFNVLNHLHLNKYTKFQESDQNSLDRYLLSIKILLEYVNKYQIVAVSLSEVTDEYYDAFVAIIDKQIALGHIFVFYERQSVMTVFFKHLNITIKKIERVITKYHPERDRIQVFNLTLKMQNQSKSKNITYINIHGYGLPDIREKYLYNTIIYLDQMRKNQLIYNDLLCCGDFNTDIDLIFQVIGKAKMNGDLNDLSVYRDFQSTSYHRYILGPNGKFTEKPKMLWYSKMDQLLYTDQFKILSFIRIPDDFTDQTRPYIMLNGKQLMSSWPSDHTLNIYSISI